MSLRLTSVGRIAKPPLRAARPRRGAAEPKARRPVYFAESGRLRRLPDPRPLRAARPARASPGPAVSRSSTRPPSSTPASRVRVDEVGNLIIEREADVTATDPHQPGSSPRHRRLEGRDGRRCATGSGSRPTSTGPRATASSRRGASRRSSASRRTTRPSGATPRSPTSSSRTATPSCSRTSATATAPRARSEYFHSATPHTGEDGYDTIEWIAAQPWSNGRTGMVGSSYACDHADPHRARARRRT